MSTPAPVLPAAAAPSLRVEHPGLLTIRRWAETIATGPVQRTGALEVAS